MGAFLSSKIVSDLFFGLTNGVIIALLALSLVLIWRSTHVLNFAQGAMAGFVAYFGMGLLSYNVPYWYCFIIAIVAGMLLGGLTERLLVRRLYGKPEINPIVVTVGMLLLLESLTTAIWSSTPRPLPTPFSTSYWLLGTRVMDLSPFAVFQITSAALVALSIGALFRFTKVGLQLRAAAVAPEVSRLLGVRVGRMLTLGWALSTGVGAVAAVVFSSQSGSGLTPGNLDQIFVFGFAAAVIGGLESPSGALISGLAIGVMNAFVQDYTQNSSYMTLGVLILLVVVLMVRPNGLFSKRIVRRV